MDYLDYVSMTKGQRFGYRVKSFFVGIPKAIKAFFLLIGYFIKKIFLGIAHFFQNYGRRFAKGDAGTKLSYVIMGMGNIFHGQIVKGLIFLGIQVGYIIFMINFGVRYLVRIDNPNWTVLRWDFYHGAYRMGTHAVGIEVAKFGDTSTGVEGILNMGTYDDSSKILLFFILTVVVTIVFLAIYIANTKSAYYTQQLRAEGKKPDNIVKEIKSFFDERFHVTLLILPVLLLCTFTILPILYTVLMAFTNYDVDHLTPTSLFQWVGFNNFASVFVSNPQKSETFGKILLWTIVWAIFATFTNYIFGIILALMINKKGIKFKAFWRTVFVITTAVPQFVTLLVMKLLLSDNGAVNGLVGSLNIEGLDYIPFLSDGNWARITVIVVNMWVGIPYTMLITSGLLMNIPEDLYESARIDGANTVQQFFKITLPYIFFVTTPYLITTFVGNINNFNVIYFLTAGGPKVSEYYCAGKTDLLVTWLYNLTTGAKPDYKLAAVIGILIFILCAAGSLITFNLSKSSKNEEEFS